MHYGRPGVARQEQGGRGSRLARVLAGVAFFVAWPLAGAGPEDEAIGVVERLHGALVEAAAAEPAPDLAGRYDALAPVITETHDLATMGRLTVRRFWRDWSETERDAFLATFERLSITTYASRFASIGPDSFEILGSETVGDDRAEVSALIRRRDADDVPMTYLMQTDGERWRIINVFADGASELSLIASEYYAILESGTLDDLIAEVESRIAAF